eukprot:TRINITY_DN6825_c0_g1_i6.p1 TRINITY_DN6825_c0_g1~~TRINITY_DN6825_c0_g1_i6.p1  ORF type:complete len:660 (+),score=105.87 TRINITY_DN6825_c0_g1_i6:1377-3356(+)
MMMGEAWRYGILFLLFLAVFSHVIPSIYGLGCGPSSSNSSMLSFYPDSIDLRAPSPNPTYPSYIEFQGLKLAINSSNGQLQVLEQDRVVWSWGLPNKSCTGPKGCHLVFQNDGNLVLYYPQDAIGTSSYNKGASNVIFTTSPPYLAVVTRDCVQVWPTATDGPQVGPLPRTTPVLGYTRPTDAQIDMMAPSSVSKAASWKRYFGVNTHCSHGWNSDMVYNLTTYLGVGAIRDGMPFPNQVNDYARMFAKGIKLNTAVGGCANISQLRHQVQAFSDFETEHPGMLLHIEGFNEINNFGFTYNGFNKSITYEGMAQARRDLYQLVRSFPNLANIPVLDLSGGGFLDGPSFNLTNWEGVADMGTLHNYAYGGWPFVNVACSNDLFLLSLGGTYPTWQPPMSNYVMTETGYHTDSFPNGVTETAQGKLVVNTLLSGMKLGLKQVYIYELVDEYWDGYAGPESHFGLFRGDKSPKPAARALHFLSSLLNDNDDNNSTKCTTPSSSSSLTLSGLPMSSDYILFRNSNSNCSYILVLWNNIPVYDSVSRNDIITSPTQVTLTLPFSSRSLQVFDIYDANADDKMPLSPSSVSRQHTRTIQFPLADTAVVVVFAPDDDNDDDSSSDNPTPTPPSPSPINGAVGAGCASPSVYIITLMAMLLIMSGLL